MKCASCSCGRRWVYFDRLDWDTHVALAFCLHCDDRPYEIRSLGVPLTSHPGWIRIKKRSRARDAR